MTAARAGFFRSALILVLGLISFAAPAMASSEASLVMDAESGRVLYARNADASRAPASLTKMMTLYILFDYLDSGRMTLKDVMTASSNAASQSPTVLGLDSGDTLTVEQAIYALVIQSANDVSVVIAEHIGGSTEKFAQTMTKRARDLGMRRTTFRNPNGLPNDQQVTTARDMAILSRALMRDHPRYFPYFSATSFTFRGKTTQTHNHVLVGLQGANGIKTGYTRASGYNLTTSAERNGKRLIGVVLGGGSTSERDNEMKTMLEAWFSQLQRRPTLIASYEGARGETAPLVAANYPVAPAPLAVAAASPDSAPKRAVIVAAAQPVAKTVEVAAAEPVADTRRAIAMQPIPDEAPTAPVVAAVVPVENPARAKPVEIAYSVPTPAAKPGSMGGAVKTVKANVKNVEVAQGDTDTEAPVIPRAKRLDPKTAKTIPLRALTSDNPDDIATLISAGYAKDGSGKAVASAKVAGDWGIQIGAFDSKASAQGELNRARKTAKANLASADDAVTAVKSGGKTLYRARFTGMTNAQAANACKALKGNFQCASFSNDTASAN